MNLFKKKSFLNRASSQELTELMIEMVLSIDSSENCWNGRRIHFISLINDILCHERDNHSLVLSASEYEKTINLDYLIELKNQNRICNRELHKKLTEALLLLPGIKTDETSKIFSSEPAIEQFNFLANYIIRTIPVLKLLDTKIIKQ